MKTKTTKSPDNSLFYQNTEGTPPIGNLPTESPFRDENDIETIVLPEVKTTEVSVDNTEALVVQIEAYQLEKETKTSLSEHLLPFYTQYLEWKEKAQALVVTDASQVEKMAQAGDARKALKHIRGQVEDTRKKLKEDSKKKGEAIDGVARFIRERISRIEDHLEKQEKFVEIQEAKEREAKRVIRLELLKPYEVDTQYFDLLNMTDPVFDMLLETSRTNYNNKIQAAKKAEGERLAKEKSEKITNERILLLSKYGEYIPKLPIDKKDKIVTETKLPNGEIAICPSDNLGEISEGEFQAFISDVEKEKQIQLTEKERVRLENEKLKSESAEREAKQLEETKKANELAAIQKELVNKRYQELTVYGLKFNGEGYELKDVFVDYQQISTLNELEWTGLLSEVKPRIDKILAAQETERQTEIKQLQAEAAAKTKKQLEEKAEKEAKRLADEDKKAMVAQKKKERLLPDKEKLINFADSIDNLNKPTINDPEADEILSQAITTLNKVVKFIKDKAETL